MKTTLLKQEQIWGENALDVIKEYGTKTSASDLAVILGATLTGSGTKAHDGGSTCWTWSASADFDKNVRIVSEDGYENCSKPYRRTIAARPALPSSVTSTISLSAAQACQIGYKTFQVVKYGEYPQTVASEDVNEQLEACYKNNFAIKKTGKFYTFDSENWNSYDKSFNLKQYPEYEYQRDRYIQVIAQPYDSDSKLSNGDKVKAGKAYWVKVEPIEWLVDKSGWWVAKKALFAGIQFDRKNTHDGNFDATDIAKYLKDYFDKEAFAPIQNAAENIKDIMAGIEVNLNAVTPDIINKACEDWQKFIDAWNNIYSKAHKIKSPSTLAKLTAKIKDL